MTELVTLLGVIVGLVGAIGSVVGFGGGAIRWLDVGRLCQALDDGVDSTVPQEGERAVLSGTVVGVAGADSDRPVPVLSEGPVLLHAWALHARFSEGIVGTLLDRVLGASGYRVRASGVASGAVRIDVGGEDILLAPREDTFLSTNAKTGKSPGDERYEAGIHVEDLLFDVDAFDAEREWSPDGDRPGAVERFVEEAVGEGTDDTFTADLGFSGGPGFSTYRFRFGEASLREGDEVLVRGVVSTADGRSAVVAPEDGDLLLSTRDLDAVRRTQRHHYRRYLAGGLASTILLAGSLATLLL